MSDAAQEVRHLLREAKMLDHGDTRIMLTEEAVRLAELQCTLDVQFDAQNDLIDAATHGGAPDKALVAFSWSLAQIDKNPGRFPEWQILWRYKWIAGRISGFSQISRSQIAEILDDMERRFQQSGYSLRPVYSERWRVARAMGDTEDAELYYLELEASHRDSMADCPACELDERMLFHIFKDDYERAMRIAEPILEETGRLRCSRVPDATFAHALLPLVRLGRHEDAMRYHLKGYRLARNKDFLYEVSEHLLFLVLTENFDKAINVFEKHFQWAIGIADHSSRFHFYLAAWFLLEQLRERGKSSLKLRMPSSFSEYREGGKYETVRVIAWLRDETQELANRFNARNGNDFYTQKISETFALTSLMTPFHVQKTGRGRTLEAYDV